MAHSTGHRADERGSKGKGAVNRHGTQEGMRMSKHKIIFFLDGKRILEMSAHGAFTGEIESAIGLLAHERGVSESDIYFAEVGST